MAFNLASKRPAPDRAGLAGPSPTRVRSKMASAVCRTPKLASAFSYAAMQPTAATALMAAVALMPGILSGGAAWAGKTRSAVDAHMLASLT